MSAAELLPWLNLLVLPMIALQLRIEHRLTRLEGLRPRVGNLEQSVFHRRNTDFQTEGE